MPLRSLTESERQRIMRLTEESVDITLIQPTMTGLKKSILDATAPVRRFLRERNIHDYDTQGQGADEHRIKIDAVLLSSGHAVKSRASLYRPKTKAGDPRIWFTGLQNYANPDDMIAITVHEGQMVLINITQVEVEQILDFQQCGALWDIIQDISGTAQSVANELLSNLRRIAATGYVPSVMEKQADTAIGRTLETELGITINSSREPDYKGIELKSYRRRVSGNRKTLFAKVPNWKISKFKSSREILDAFGYGRGDAFKLYCTTSTKNCNAQGLYFDIDNQCDVLNECSSQSEIGAFASWFLEDLRASLAAKHNETFWIGADEHEIDGRAHFEFKEVLHTRKPISSQFDILLEQGEITMDHLIKRDAKGHTREKGPLFKVKTASLPLLFPPSQKYLLS